MMEGIFIVAAKRTPFGAFGGSLKHMSATDLGVASTVAALKSKNIDPNIIDAIFFGNVIQSSPDAAYLARHIGLKSQCPISSPALTINRLCGSGFESMIQGIHAIRAGDAKVVICGGTESMSRSPLSIDGMNGRWGIPLGKGLSVRDTLWDGLTDMYSNTPMGVTAENLAVKYGITREECDKFAIRSQQAWAKAKQDGIFDLEMAPIEITTKKGTKVIDTDEHPRPESTYEKISQLPPVFQKDNGVVTAANASGICDGAGTLILASESALQHNDLTPMARIVSYHVSGCEPSIMGIGPVLAIRGALERAGMNLSSSNEIDRVEINEAFAAQFLSCAKELELDMNRTNIHGGAISLGHPLGASGSRIMAHLANDFQRRKDKDDNDGKNVHVGSACIGGGQGIAVVIEKA